jgi:hypothetical protein
MQAKLMRVTPYAVVCPDHGLQCLEQGDYEYQMSKADAGWRCPMCLGPADWSDSWYEDIYPQYLELRPELRYGWLQSVGLVPFDWALNVTDGYRKLCDECYEAQFNETDPATHRLCYNKHGYCDDCGAEYHMTQPAG